MYVVHKRTNDDTTVCDYVHADNKKYTQWHRGFAHSSCSVEKYPGIIAVACDDSYWVVGDRGLMWADIIWFQMQTSARKHRIFHRKKSCFVWSKNSSGEAKPGILLLEPQSVLEQYKTKSFHPVCVTISLLL